MLGALGKAGRTLFAPLIHVGSWYNTAAKANPMVTGVITSGLKTSAADIFAQKVLEKREEIDWRRHLTFTAFGYCYLGGFQYWLYNIQFTRMCSSIHATVGAVGVAPMKTFIDQMLHHPILYFPTFYSLKYYNEGKSPAEGLAAYSANCTEDWKALWSVWIPAQMVNFAFVPRHLRIPYVAGVSFIWTVILSVMRGSEAEAEAKAEAEEKHKIADKP